MRHATETSITTYYMMFAYLLCILLLITRTMNHEYLYGRKKYPGRHGYVSHDELHVMFDRRATR